MAAFTTNAAPFALRKIATATLAHLVASLQRAPKTADQHRAATQRREEARARVDHLLR